MTTIYRSIVTIMLVAIPFTCLWFGLSVGEAIIIIMLYILIVKIQNLVDASVEFTDAIDELISNKNSNENRENQDH